MESLGRRLIAEFLGTFGFFFLGFTGIAAATEIPGAITSAGVAAGFGLGVAMMIFAFGHISGGHFNPAVTLGLACGRRFPWKEAAAYWGAQLAGGLGACLAIALLFGEVVTDALPNRAGDAISDAGALGLEGLTTFLFLLVIMAVATDERAAWHGVMAPVAIGGFIFTAATVVGPFTSGSFNPARSLAPSLVAGSFEDLWIFVIGPMLGAAAAGFVYAFIRRSGTAAEVQEEAMVDRDVRAPVADERRQRERDPRRS